MISGRVDMDFFAWSFHYFIGSHEEMMKLDAKINGNDTNETKGYLSWVVPDKRTLFLVDVAGPDTISHEALHLTNMCLKHIGHVIDTDNDEVQAHLQSWVIRQINKAVLKYNRKTPTTCK
jgi:hypothetical protein